MLLGIMSRNAKSRAKPSPKPPPHRLRIIGGRWRGVPIVFPSRPQLRPTPDRVRETIFNWLQPVTADARCLDLFAGSGALGFEALSRGASHVVLVDRDPVIVRHLQDTARKLASEQAECIASDAQHFLSQPPTPFDIVFLDPPYASGVLASVCEQLDDGWLRPAAFVYLEAPADAGLPVLPRGWTSHRSKVAGQVGYHLLRAGGSTLDQRLPSEATP
jgi:16S rRNA (guanine966-N2)-methyltransferase